MTDTRNYIVLSCPHIENMWWSSYSSAYLKVIVLVNTVRMYRLTSRINIALLVKTAFNVKTSQTSNLYFKSKNQIMYMHLEKTIEGYTLSLHFIVLYRSKCKVAFAIPSQSFLRRMQLMYARHIYIKSSNGRQLFCNVRTNLQTQYGILAHCTF